MNLPHNGKDYAGLATLVIAISLGLVLVIAAVAELFFDSQLSEGGSRLLTALATGLVGVLGVYIGHHINGRKNGGGPPV